MRRAAKGRCNFVSGRDFAADCRDDGICCAVRVQRVATAAVKGDAVEVRERMAPARRVGVHVRVFGKKVMSAIPSPTMLRFAFTPEDLTVRVNHHLNPYIDAYNIHILILKLCRLVALAVDPCG
jgi:hypothetical protein